MTMDQKGRTIPAGSLLRFSFGMDDEVENSEVYRAEREINRAREIEMYEMYVRDELPDSEPHHAGFINWLIYNKFLVKIPSYDWYLGDHMKFDPRTI